MITYVEDTSRWEDWQRDYRLGSHPDSPAVRMCREEINRLRARYDPRSAAWCPAHISLSDPLSREMSPALAGEIRGAVSAIRPFTLHYDELYASSRHAGCRLSG